MLQRIILVHGWGGNSNKDWFPWVKQEFEKKGYEVLVPDLPETNYPKIEKWVPFLAGVVGKADKHTILIGHSMGCQTILRYLETLGEGESVGTVILVAGFVTLTGLKPEEQIVANPWLETPVDFAKVKTKANKFIAIFSDDDPYVPMEENAKIFKEKLGAEIVIQNGQKHFNGDDLPVLLEVIK